MKISKARLKAKETIRLQGGMIRTAEAIQFGIHPRTLNELLNGGELEQISRGVYRLTEAGPVSNLDLITVAARIPKGVICLISALAFHEITTQIPHAVSVALKKGSELPRLTQPPVSIHWYSETAFTEGIEMREIDSIAIKIYSAEKTLADCFKFRNKLGMDIVLEALKLYRVRKKFNIELLLHYAKICRVEKVMKPYLEATL